MKYTCWFSKVALLLFVLCLVTAAHGGNKRILVLNAYHEGYHWSDRIMAGIKTVLSAEEDVELFVDYMDTKRCSDAQYFEKLRDIYAHKYRLLSFDTIISCDDHALDFLLTYRDELFPDVPVAFCGINDYHPERIAGHRLFTGVYETYDIAGTVELMLRIHPEATEIVAITDATLSGGYFLNRLRRAEPQFAGKATFKYLTNPSMVALKDTLENLPPSALVLWAVYLRTPEGVSISCEESVRFVTDNSVRPVYCVWDVVGQGVVGGKVTSPDYQGEAVARRALALLRGERIEDMTVGGSPMVHLFDFEALRRFGIPLKSLPSGSLIMNRPYSVYAEYKDTVWLVAGFVLLLLVIIIALIYDIQKRRQAERALRTSEERYRIMSQRTGQMIYDYDIGSGAVAWAGAIADITGFTPTEFSHIDVDQWAELIHEEDRPEALALLDSAMAAGTNYKAEYRVQRKNGGFATVEDSGTFLKDAAGNAYRMLGSMKDISERRRIEEQLRHSEKMGALGQLAGGIAHDFNNQLAGVVGYADLLLGELQDEELRGYAEAIKTSARRSADLTAQLLAFGRRGKYLASPLNIHDVINDVASMLKRSIDKRINLILSLKADSSVVLGDPTQLQNAILNIALNARDAMPNGGDIVFVTQTVELDSAFCSSQRYEVDPGTYIELSISDTGCGMDQETQQHIFEPFFTTKAVGKGTGMGLASVYGTVTNHHGTISVHSKPGQGTVVTVYLPQSAGVTHHEGADSPCKVPVKGDARILLVDDEAVVRRSTNRMLQSLGYTVIEAADGRRAVDIYRESWKEIDVVILDMIMPEMNGKETYAALSKINPDVCVILSSGYSIDGEAQEVLDKGAKTFIGKPYGKAELSRILSTVLLAENLR